MMSRIRAFLAFWYDFLVGDDWIVAFGIVLALAVTAGLARAALPAWWLLPVAVLGLLALSLGRATHRKQ